jgi:thiol-disulfide isomerase/thioredoxin
MKGVKTGCLVVSCLLVSNQLLAGHAKAATPTAAQALQLVPIQKDVEYDRPTGEEIAKCTVAAKKFGGQGGWLVQSATGLTLRRFVDTNNDNVVDLWSYYKDGLEVYRDIDANHNGKADQYRWFNTGGTRWGTDNDEDGAIDQWKVISAEETSAEIVRAMAERDPKRFGRVAMAGGEVKQLGLGPAKAQQLAEKVGQLQTGFRQSTQTAGGIPKDAKWVQFSGGRPGTVPAGADDSTKELRVYENAVAIAESAEGNVQVQIGTLVQTGDVWRAIDVPQVMAGEAAQMSGFFFQIPALEPVGQADSGPSEASQKLMAELEKLDQAAAQATTPEEQARVNARRADLLAQIAESAQGQEKGIWLRQLADMVSAAVQSGGYPDGAKRLEGLFADLDKKGEKELAAYVRFRHLMAEYGLAIQQATPQEFGKVQSEWLKKLEGYVEDYPKSPDTAEAILQLAMAEEFSGEEENAKKWYSRIVSDFAQSAPAEKAAGAIKRLDSVGKVLLFQGKNAAGGTIDLSNYRGKVVLLQYWATWCEPCKADMAAIKELFGKFGRSGFEVVGVNVDTTPQEMSAYLGQNPLPWPHVYEEGGLDSRPANDLGILTLPTMLLLDREGKVVNRNVQTAELEREIQKLLQ